jgi:prevent-host-death family protein
MSRSADLIDTGVRNQSERGVQSQIGRELSDELGNSAGGHMHDARPCRETVKRLYLVLFHHRGPAMRYSSQVKPISYLKANAAEVLTNLTEQREPLVITQNGEAKAVLQDVASFEQTQETLALLKILALGNQDVAAGKTKPAADIVARLRAKRATA